MTKGRKETRRLCRICVITIKCQFINTEMCSQELAYTRVVVSVLILSRILHKTQPRISLLGSSMSRPTDRQKVQIRENSSHSVKADDCKNSTLLKKISQPSLFDTSSTMARSAGSINHNYIYGENILSTDHAQICHSDGCERAYQQWLPKALKTFYVEKLSLVL